MESVAVKAANAEGANRLIAGHPVKLSGSRTLGAQTSESLSSGWRTERTALGCALFYFLISQPPIVQVSLFDNQRS